MPGVSWQAQPGASREIAVGTEQVVGGAAGNRRGRRNLKTRRHRRSSETADQPVESLAGNHRRAIRRAYRPNRGPTQRGDQKRSGQQGIASWQQRVSSRSQAAARGETHRIANSQRRVHVAGITTEGVAAAATGVKRRIGRKFRAVAGKHREAASRGKHIRRASESLDPLIG